MTEQDVTRRGRRGGTGPIRATPMTGHIGAQVRQLRKEQGLSGSQLAARVATRGVACSRTTVAKLENGHRATVSVEELLAWASALDVPTSRLLPPEHAARLTPDQVLAQTVRALTDLRRDLAAGPS